MSFRSNDGIKIGVSKKVYAKDTCAATTQVQSISGMSNKEWLIKSTNVDDVY